MLAELAFIQAMILAHPKIHDIAHGLASIPLGNSSYLYLLTANIGAVIMPWTNFYQQGAVIDKKLPVVTIRQARADTAAVLTQVINDYGRARSRRSSCRVVASLAGSWGLAEVVGWKHNLNERPSRANEKCHLT